MKIVSMSAFPLNIPFVQQFAHATKTRTSSDAVILRVELENGMVGWGETLVREYVTGESVAILLGGLKKSCTKTHTNRFCDRLEWRYAACKVATFDDSFDNRRSITARI